MRLSADGRVDFINQFDKQWSWRAAAGWRILPKLVVKVIGGRAFQTPSTVFLYASSGFGTADIQGSRNIPAAAPLVPQVVQSAELVLNFVQGQHLSINASGYAQSIEKQITFITTGPTFVARNQGNADSRGVEANVTARFWRLEPYGRVSQQWFTTHPNRPRSTRSRRATAVRPRLLDDAGPARQHPAPRITFDASWRYVGERGASQGNIFLNSSRSYALAAYQQLDLATTASFAPLGKGHDTRLLFAVRNVLDERHSEPGFGGIDVPSLGRTFQLTLSQAY